MPYHHLTPAEREVLDSMHRCGYSQGEIAKALKRHPSTISRELRRNHDTVGRRYCPHWANLQYWKRREQVVNAHKTGDLVRRAVTANCRGREISLLDKWMVLPHN